MGETCIYRRMNKWGKTCIYRRMIKWGKNCIYRRMIKWGIFNGGNRDRREFWRLAIKRGAIDRWSTVYVFPPPVLNVLWVFNTTFINISALLEICTFFL
jgi:hypothetical protein